VHASNQRVSGGAALGSGKGEPAAGADAAAFGCFGAFGRFRAALGGGPAGFNSATTGSGSSVVDAGAEKSPGLRTTCTGTVSGWNFGRVKVTENPLSGAGTETEQGVLQPGPNEVTASAPGGTDSSWTWTAGGAGLRESNDNEEQPARPTPATAIAITRRMINHSTAAIGHNPRWRPYGGRNGGATAWAYPLKEWLIQNYGALEYPNESIVYKACDGGWQVAHMADQPVRLEFCDGNIGIAKFDPDDGNTGAAGDPDVRSGIADHDGGG
jgi:hypothetical protein